MTARRAAPATIAECSISIRLVRGLTEIVEQSGASPARLLRAAGLATSQIGDPDARLPILEVCRICQLAIDLTENPALGLHWGERLTGHAFLPVSHLVYHADNLRDGLAALARFEPLLGDESRYQLIEHGDVVAVRCRRFAGESQRIQAFWDEMMLAAFYRLIRMFSPHAQPERVSFTHAAPDHQAEYTRVFKQAARFAQPCTEMVLERAVLDAPSPHRDEDAHEAMLALAERRSARLAQRAPYAHRVREFLLQQGAAHRADMASVARALGLSVRSLRRRLASEGRPYYQLEYEALAAVAGRLLRDRQLTIQETAFEMGFSDTTAFHRAFKRWTGMTPSAWRDRG